MSTFLLEIVTPERKVYAEQCKHGGCKGCRRGAWNSAEPHSARYAIENCTGYCQEKGSQRRKSQ